MNDEPIQIGQVEVKFKLEPADTNGNLAMFEFSVPAGAKVPVPHYHREYDEVAYGLQGSMTFTVDGKEIEIGPGDSVFIPRGAVHGFKNNGESLAKALAVVTPGLISFTFFKEVADVLMAGGPPDLSQIKDVMLKHGLVPVLP